MVSVQFNVPFSVVEVDIPDARIFIRSKLHEPPAVVAQIEAGQRGNTKVIYGDTIHHRPAYNQDHSGQSKTQKSQFPEGGSSLLSRKLPKEINEKQRCEEKEKRPGECGEARKKPGESEFRDAGLVGITGDPYRDPHQQHDDERAKCLAHDCRFEEEHIEGDRVGKPHNERYCKPVCH